MLDFNNLPEYIKKQLPYDLSVDQTLPDTNNYLANNKFIFMLRRCPTLTHFCQRVNVPSISFGVSAQSNPTGHAPTKRPGTSYVLDDLTVGFLVDENMKTWLELYSWFVGMGLYNGSFEPLKEKDKVSDAFLLINNSASIPILSVSFYNVFPNSISGIDFDATLEDTFPIISSVSFSYTYYEIKVL